MGDAFLCGSGSGTLKSAIIAKAPTGATVTCTKGSTVKEAEENGGQWIFKGLDLGTWRVEARLNDQVAFADKVLDKLTIAYVELSFFNATIAAIYPVGATCTCTTGDKVLTAPDTSGRCTFVIPEAGDWTVKAVQGSDSDSVVVGVTEEKSYSVELSFVEWLIKDGTAQYELFKLGNFDQGTAPGAITVTPKINEYSTCTLYLQNIDLTGYNDLVLDGVFTLQKDKSWASLRVSDPHGDWTYPEGKIDLSADGAALDVSALSGEFNVGIQFGGAGVKQSIEALYLAE